MKAEHYEKIWSYIKKSLKDPNGLMNLESFNGDRELQKSQYLIYRKEILDYFSQKLNTEALLAREKPETAHAIMMKNIKRFPYYKDLADMGINPRALFDSELDNSSAEEDYQYWRNG